VLAAISIGSFIGQILWKHILPNSWTPIIVTGALYVTQIIITEATLGFLGLGVPPPAPSWGSMLSDGRDYLWLTP